VFREDQIGFEDRKGDCRGDLMAHILVTGGAGYIGSHTAKILSGSSFQPLIVDNLSTGHRWAAMNHPLCEIDLGNRLLLSRVFRRHKISAVIHFAACAYVGESIEQPQKYFQNNVVNTLNLLEVMRDAGVNLIVFSSTCATYGVPRSVPIKENHAQHPINPYGESKLFLERVLHSYARAYGQRSVILRYFNAAGADPEGELGECHDREPHLIPRIIGAALKEQPGIDVFGTDFPTPDGTAVRDYIHVMDLARAHVLAVQYLLDGSPSNIFNLGTGRGYSVLETIKSVERVAGTQVPVHLAPRRAGDPPVLVADNAKAQKVLGWRPEFLDIDAIIRTAWMWHSVHSISRRLTPVLAGGTA
jgi:UDP-glucose-4-epimerase GalE